ncbi:MAG: helix-turn-helix transcriptional regulator [Nitrosomonas sp.]|nr:helix-turn-helix transcriptional regulator [Nitrosomonas sp.]
MKFGEKIRAERKRLKLTLEDLAEKTGSSKSYIWELENNASANPSIEKIVKISNVIGVTVDFLLNDESINMEPVDFDNVLFKRIIALDTVKRSQLEKFLNAIED